MVSSVIFKWVKDPEPKRSESSGRSLQASQGSRSSHPASVLGAVRAPRPCPLHLRSCCPLVWCRSAAEICKFWKPRRAQPPASVLACPLPPGSTHAGPPAWWTVEPRDTGIRSPDTRWRERRVHSTVPGPPGRGLLTSLSVSLSLSHNVRIVPDAAGQRSSHGWTGRPVRERDHVGLLGTRDSLVHLSL